MTRTHERNIEIEAVVRARLERDAERIDPRPLFQKIERSLASLDVAQCSGDRGPGRPGG